MPYDPLFQYQVKTEPVLATPEAVQEDKWHQPWSEPKRFKQDPKASIALAASGLFFSPQQAGEAIFEDKWHFPWSEPIIKTKIGLRTGSQQFFAFQPTPIINIGWFAPLSEPVRVKPGLKATNQRFLFEGFPQPVLLNWFNWWSEPKRFKRGLAVQDQPFFSFQPRPIIDIGWFQGLSEPKRFKRALRTGLEPTNVLNIEPLVSFSWFGWLSEPKRFLKGLLAGQQRDLGRAEFIPFSYTLSMDAIEQGDFLKAVLYQFNAATSAYVDIIEKNPHHMGNLGIIENVAQSSIVTGIVEPDPTFTAGTPVSTVASARVAIILR